MARPVKRLNRRLILSAEQPCFEENALPLKGFFYGGHLFSKIRFYNLKNKICLKQSQIFIEESYL